MANIPAWNWINYATEPQPINADSVLSAEELWDKWTIEGIVRSEEGELTQWDQPHLEHEQEIKPMSKHYLERIKKIFNKKARRRKKRLSID